jgi:streptogramin lyase
MVLRRAAPVLASLLALLLTGPAAVAAPVIDGHFPTSTTGTNKKIVAGPDGNMWVTVDGGGKDVARISPAGQVDEFELEGVAAPTGIGVDPQGRIWVTQNGGVASFLPADPKGTSKATAIADVKDPASIVAGPDGRMWVATEAKVVAFAPDKPNEPTSYNVPKLAPKDIDVAGSLLIIADSGNSRLITMTTAGVGNALPLYGTTTQSQGVAGKADGEIAFSKSDGTEGLGLFSPSVSPTVVEMPGDPFGVALGSDGAYWFAMSAANNLQRLTPSGTATPLNGMPEFPGIPEYFPRQIAAGPNNTLWVTLEVPGENVYEVARVTGLEPPTPPGGGGGPAAPETTIDKGPKKRIAIKGRAKRAWAKFRFSSPTPGATFECALVKKPRRKGAKVPRPVFRACKSPGKLRLKPGRYTFSVRAVKDGVADPTPATRSFRIVRARRRK